MSCHFFCVNKKHRFRAPAYFMHLSSQHTAVSIQSSTFKSPFFGTGARVRLASPLSQSRPSISAAALHGMQLSALAEHPGSDMTACFASDDSTPGEAYGVGADASCLIQPLLVQKQAKSLGNTQSLPASTTLKWIQLHVFNTHYLLEGQRLDYMMSTVSY